jgi:murein DD-endopeptidase / murein LD-carboxypeptidase
MPIATAETIAARGLAQLGTPFRLRGRTPGVALDCVGLVAHALNIESPPHQYSLKGTKYKTIKSYLDNMSLQNVSESAMVQEGDVAVVACAERQFHLMIAVEGGWVHSHAGLGRVVRMAGPSPWPLIGLWRAIGG